MNAAELAEAQLERARQATRARLALSRAVNRVIERSLRRVCLCELCGRRATDLHEVLITRANAQGAPVEVRRLVLTGDENLLWLCNDCNVHLGEVEEFRDWLIAVQIRRYGAVRLLAWLETVPLNKATYQRRRVEAMARTLARPDAWGEFLNCLWSACERHNLYPSFEYA
jgi:hypothetical protein